MRVFSSLTVISVLYRESDCAVIHKTKEANGEGSNMCSGFPIRDGGILFHSSEVLYQLKRFPRLWEHRLTPEGPTLFQDINVPNAMLAKMKSKKYRHLTREDWDRVRVEEMESVMRLKVDQHYDRMMVFMRLTQGRDIVEKSRRDRFWGAVPDGRGNLDGENVLGLLWMLLREEYS